MKYYIGKPHYYNQSLLVDTHKTQWVIDERIPPTNSMVEAKLNWLLGMKELTEDSYTDKFITRVFQPFVRMELVKIIKVKE